MEMTLPEIISSFSSFLEPVPVPASVYASVYASAVQSKPVKKPAVKAVLFDLYGTLFISEAGDISTQIMLLNITVGAAIILFTSSIVYGSVLVLSGAGRKKHLTGKYIFFLASLLISAAVFTLSKIILVWSG